MPRFAFFVLSLAAITASSLSGSRAQAMDAAIIYAAIDSNPRPVYPPDLPADFPHNTKPVVEQNVNWARAWQMLWLSEAAYWDGLPVSARTRCVERWGLSHREFIHEREAEALVSEAADRIVVTVAGSKDGRDWIWDLVPEPVQFEGVWVHAGFKHYAELLWPSVRKAVMTMLKENRQREIWLGGHSLGGATSQLLAVLLKEELVAQGYDNVLRVETFGSPRVGLLDWVVKYEDQANLYATTIRWTNYKDMMVVYPPGYDHAGRRFHFHHDDDDVWLEVNAPDYDYPLGKIRYHKLTSGVGYAPMFERLVPDSQAGMLAKICDEDLERERSEWEREQSEWETHPPTPNNGCEAREYCCEPISEGVCGLCVEDPIRCP